jgi:tetratricopeptide (TPR) repeat protein
MGRHAEATADIARALGLATEPRTRVVARIYQIDLWRLAGRWSDAREAIAMLQDDARADRSVYATWLQMSATLEPDPAEAIELLEEAMAVHRSIGDDRNEGQVLNTLGAMHLARQQPDAAQRAFEAAIDVFRRVRDRRMEALCLGNLGVVFSRPGTWSQAIPLYERAARLHAELGARRSESITLCNLAEVHVRCHELRAARTRVQAALDVARSLEDVATLALVRGLFGEVRALQGDLEGGVRTLRRAIEASAAVEMSDLYVSLRCRLARVHVLADARPLAHAVLDEAQAHLDARGIPPDSELAGQIRTAREGVEPDAR